MTALGVGIGVAVLLLAAALPAVLAARDQRQDARDDELYAQIIPPAEDTLLIATVDSVWHGKDIRGRLIRPDGADAPLPPGLPRFPTDGTAFVSPALRAAMDGPKGAGLRSLVPYKVTGTIGDAGLAGPQDLAYYAGDADLRGRPGVPVQRLAAFGDGVVNRTPLIWTLLLAIVLVTLLLPVGVFIGVAVRFGGEARDRRLAALRLAGADSRSTMRIAAGETLVGSVFGLALGSLLFAGGRTLVPLVSIMDVSAFAADVRPVPTLVALIVLGVPCMAVLVTLLVLRRVVIEPLTVVRRSNPAPRLLWWRILLPVVGTALLYPLLDGAVGERRDSAVAQVVVGLALVLSGLVPLVPWLVATVVRLWRGRGPVSWQLAIQRLRLHPETSTRAVSGIAVGVAGAIALQMVFAAADDVYQQRTGQDPGRAQYAAVLAAGPGTPGRDAVSARYREIDHVKVATVAVYTIASEESTSLIVGDCVSLRMLAPIDRCAEGDVFVPPPSAGANEVRPGQSVTISNAPPGYRLKSLPGSPLWNSDPVPSGTWRIPALARKAPVIQDPLSDLHGGVLATPAAVPTSVLGLASLRSYLEVDPSDEAAVDRIRGTAVDIDPLTQVEQLREFRAVGRYGPIRAGLTIGAVVVLLLMSLSLLLTVTDRLRENRRLLSVLVALGVGRATLTRSVLWETLVPVLLGIALAGVVGVGLGAALQLVTGLPPQADLWAILAMEGMGALVVMLASALALPGLWRLLGSQEIRYE
ncbi:FtsX-like permease family protein [Micromonospora chokoriensis]